MSNTFYCAHCLTSFEGELEGCPNLACREARPPGGWGVLLGPGDLLDRNYVIERCLAVGGAGLTYLAREIGGSGVPTGPRLAIKVLYSARAGGPFLRRLSNEAQILQELAHEHIVQLRGFVHRAGHEPYLVTLFEEGGSLSQHVARVGPLSLQVGAGVIRQVLLALDVAHQRGVVHRDLKPDNVLLAARNTADELPHCRVADFGIAKVAGGVGARLTRHGAFVGTPEYAAPEQFGGQQPTPATDVFSAGGLLVFLLTGRPPVRFSHRADIETSHGELLEQLPPVVAADEVAASELGRSQLHTILENMMAVQADRRWTIHQTLNALQPLLGRAAAGYGTLEITGKPAPRRSLGPVGTLETDQGITFTIDPTDEQATPGVERAPFEEEDMAKEEDAPPPPPPSADDAPPPPPLADDAPPPPPPPSADDAPPPPPPPVADDAPPPPPPMGDAPPPPPPADIVPVLPPPPPGAPESVSDAPLPAALRDRPPPAPAPPPPRAPPPPPPKGADAPPPPPPPPVPSPPPAPVEAEPVDVPVPEDEQELAGETIEPPITQEADATDEDPVAVGKPFAEPPVPPLFSPSLPPSPAPVAAPVAPSVPAAPSGAGGAAAGVAGCMGLSVMGMTVLGGGGLLAVVVVLAGFAWGLGFFDDGGSGTTPPVVVEDQLRERFQDAPTLSDSHQRRLEKAVRNKAGTMAKFCGSGASVTADVLVDKSGKVIYADVGSSGLGKTEPECVQRGLERVVARGIDREGRAKISFKL